MPQDSNIIPHNVRAIELSKRRKRAETLLQVAERRFERADLQYKKAMAALTAAREAFSQIDQAFEHACDVLFCPLTRDK